MRSGRNLNWRNLLQHLQAALHLGCFRGLVPKAIDELPDASDVFVLPSFGFAEPLEPRCPLQEVRAVIPRVVGQGPECDLGDPSGDGIEEVSIVGDENDRIGIASQVLLEPVAGLEIEMIRRLVEQKQAWTLEEQLGERDAHLPASREGLGLAREVLGREP